MILIFPNQDTLQLVITSNLLPEGCGGEAADAAFADDGSIAVRTAHRLSRKEKAALKQVGVDVRRSIRGELDQHVSCLQQLVAVQRERRPEIDAQTVVLFELASGEALPELASEMLRLGNDRQSYRYLERNEQPLMLLRVVGPPYYTLLRALEAQNGAAAPRAFVERAPRVWIQLGYAHPLADSLKVPEGSMLLIRPPNHWMWITYEPFRDLYEKLDFEIPHAPVAGREVPLEQRIRVPLTLARSGGADMTELWVLRDHGAEQLDRLVRNSDNHLLARLSFAVGQHDGQQTFVLRARPSKLSPPVLALDAIGFYSYLKLPNVFMPHQNRLQPPLRRDAVARLFAEDASLVTWLYPHDGQFVPESLPDAAFRPLDTWVDYVIDQEHVALETWTRAHRFDFERFICPEEHEDGPDEDAESTPRTTQQTTPEQRPGIVKAQESARTGPPLTAEYEPFFVMQSDTDEQRLREDLQHREDEFKSLDLPLDAQQRGVLWLKMGELNSALGYGRDTTLCWSSAIWELEHPPLSMLKGWRYCEAPPADGESSDHAAGSEDAKDLSDVKEISGASSLVARWVYESMDSAERTYSAAHLQGIRNMLLRREANLPVRVAWLGWLAYAKLAHGDVLSLARARDRMLERLFERGLQADLDLPAFLRIGGADDADRFRSVRRHATRLHQMACGWISESKITSPKTTDYANLIFAYSFARMGETAESRQLLESARGELGRSDQVHRWLLKAYEFRIQQAIENQTAMDTFPHEMRERLDGYARFDRYLVERLLEQSRILNPHERIDPYRNTDNRLAMEGESYVAAASLVAEKDSPSLRTKIIELLNSDEFSKPKDHATILAAGLQFGPRLGESSAREMLQQVPVALSQLSTVTDQARLLEAALMTAGHFGDTESVNVFVTRFQRLLKSVRDADALKGLDTLLGQCFRGLRKFGLREEVGSLLNRIQQIVESDPNFKREDDYDRSFPALQVLAQLAAGWHYFGHKEAATRTLDEVRHALLRGNLKPDRQTALACSYVRALEQAPVDEAIPRMDELFRRLKRVNDNYVTASHYSRSQLNVIEAVALALVSDDFAVSAEVRRYLDEDEYLVRRRIHRDVRTMMEANNPT